MTPASRNASAAAVSRALARAGRRPLPSETPRSREGLRVKRSPVYLATVVADYDSPVRMRQAADDAKLILEDAGYEIRHVVDGLFAVIGKTS